MKIKLLDYKIVDLSFKITEEDAGINMSTNDLSLDVGQFYPDDEEKIFGVGDRKSVV